MSWGEKLWDKFDIVEKHTEKGIQFSRRVVQFFEEYATKKREHAQQMRKLVKQYNVNYKKGNATSIAGKKAGKEGAKDYSYESAFYVMLEHVNEMATLEETMASDLEEKIILTAKHRHNDFMSKRKQFLSAGRDHNVRLSNSMKFLETAENNFKKACKARDEAQAAFTKADKDMNVTKALVAKCEQTLKTKTELMESSKQEYLLQLKQTNEAQRSHFFEQMPLVFTDLEHLDTDRIQDLQALIHDFASLHENYQVSQRYSLSTIIWFLIVKYRGCPDEKVEGNNLSPYWNWRFFSLFFLLITKLQDYHFILAFYWDTTIFCYFLNNFPVN